MIVKQNQYIIPVPTLGTDSEIERSREVVIVMANHHHLDQMIVETSASLSRSPLQLAPSSLAAASVEGKELTRATGTCTYRYGTLLVCNSMHITSTVHYST